MYVQWIIELCYIRIEKTFSVSIGFNTINQIYTLLMKNFIKFTLIAAFFVVGLSSTEAQKFKEGQIQYEVTNIESEEMEAQMMKGTLINFYFNDSNSKMNVQMMGGMVVMDFINQKGSEEGTMLMNMMGRKVQVKQPKPDEAADQEAETPDLDIVYDKKDTKEIAGIECIKAILTDKETNEKIKMYVAEGMMPKIKMAKEMFPGLKGLPMEIILNTQGTGVTITAQKIVKSVAASDFEIPEGYEKMTQEQFQKELGGMGNFGF